MATSSVILDIRANTNRALNDFKRFSAQLDNKFLISGLKLDVVRSALGQINREFQKAIGEQGLTAGQSLRAAQNQASVLLQTFKGFGDEASTSISESFSSTFNQIAVTAGGTFDDVKKSLAATPWISADLPKEIREKLGAGVLDFQRDARRAGLGEDFAGMARQFLMGQVNAGELTQSGDPLKSAIGLKLQQAGGGPSTIVDAAQRSRVLLEVLSDPKFRDQIAKAAKGAAGFRIILEDLSSTLFNPEKGIFGAVRKVTMAVGDTTTILDETQKLVQSIFGKQGTFVLFFEQIKKIFGLEDPLKTVISGIRWLTKQFDRLNTFLQSPQVQQIVGILRTAFTNVQTFVTKLSESITTNLQDPESKINQAGKKIEEFFKNLKENIEKELKNNDSILSLIRNIGTSVGKFFKAIEETIKAGDWDPSKISQSIRGIGKSVRDFISKIGEEIRSVDVDKQGGFFLDIFTTIVGEVAETLGTAIKEAILVVFSGKGLAVVGGAMKVLYEGLSKFFAGLFGGNGPLGAVFGGAAMAGLGVLLFRRIRGIFDSILRPIQALRTGGGGVGGFVNRLLGGGRGGVDLDPNARGPSSMLGTAQTFNRQVIFYLQRIAACVCGPGGLGAIGGGGGDGPDLDRARNDSSGRSRTSSLGYGSPQRGTASYSRPIGPLPDIRRSYVASRKESARNILGRGSSRAALDAYTESLRGYDPNLDIDQRGEISSRNAQEGGQRVADRYNRRYSRRARIGRGMRGFGKGALIAGGLTLGAAALFGGGAAQASTIDPQTGEPIETSQQRQTAGVGNVLGGGLEGAMTGAAIGSIIPGIGTATGAVIGAVIGGVVPLLDEGTRKGVKEFTDGIGKSLRGTGDNIGKAFQSAGDNISKAASNGIQWIKDGFGSISKWFADIDWKSILINALVPGGSMTIDGLKGIAQFASKLNIFDAIKTGIDNIAAPVKSIWDNISSWKPPWAGREVGGPVIKGTSYIVGERGPEIFTPGASGSVSTNRDLMAMRSGGSASSVSANFNITINVNGNMGAGNVEELRGPVLEIIKRAWEEASTGVATRGSIV
jgi:uncharacterized protein YoxC